MLSGAALPRIWSSDNNLNRVFCRNVNSTWMQKHRNRKDISDSLQIM